MREIIWDASTQESSANANNSDMTDSSFLPMRRQRHKVDLAIIRVSSRADHGSVLAAQRSRSDKDMPSRRTRQKGRQENVLRQFRHRKRGTPTFCTAEPGSVRR